MSNKKTQQTLIEDVEDVVIGNSKQIEIKKDLQLAERFLTSHVDDWIRKWVDQLQFRKYRRNSKTKHERDSWHTTAQSQFGFEDISLPLTITERKKVLIKRMLTKDYKLLSRQYTRKVSRKQKFKCRLCQHQTIQYIYSVLFSGDDEFPPQKVQIGVECASMLQSLRQEKQVRLYLRHRD